MYTDAWVKALNQNAVYWVRFRTAMSHTIIWRDEKIKMKNVTFFFPNFFIVINICLFGIIFRGYLYFTFPNKSHRPLERRGIRKSVTPPRVVFRQFHVRGIFIPVWLSLVVDQSWTITIPSVQRPTKTGTPRWKVMVSNLKLNVCVGGGGEFGIGVNKRVFFSSPGFDFYPSSSTYNPNTNTSSGGFGAAPTSVAGPSYGFDVDPPGDSRSTTQPDAVSEATFTIRAVTWLLDWLLHWSDSF